MSDIIIAKIVSVHGIKGNLKLASFTANPQDIEIYLDKLFTPKIPSLKITIINQVPSKNNDLFTVKIDGVESRTQAELLRNTEIFIKRDDLEENEEDEFYYCDLIGLKVLDYNSKKIGEIMAVDDFGAGGLVEIKFNDSSYDKLGISSFAFTDDIFPEVNLREKYVTFQIPEIVEIENEE
ncbi:MAG: 16S rRNA processing protein RimM [Lentimonas sp.]|jgi:16S rRNA processing protein RimM